MCDYGMDGGVVSVTKAGFCTKQGNRSPTISTQSEGARYCTIEDVQVPTSPPPPQATLEGDRTCCMHIQHSFSASGGREAIERETVCIMHALTIVVAHPPQTAVVSLYENRTCFMHVLPFHVAFSHTRRRSILERSASGRKKRMSARLGMVTGRKGGEYIAYGPEIATKVFAELQCRDISATWKATARVRICFFIPGLLTHSAAPNSIDFEYEHDGEIGKRSASECEPTMQVCESSMSETGAKMLAEYQISYDHSIAPSIINQLASQLETNTLSPLSQQAFFAT